VPKGEGQGGEHGRPPNPAAHGRGLGSDRARPGEGKMKKIERLMVLHCEGGGELAASANAPTIRSGQIRVRAKRKNMADGPMGDEVKRASISSSELPRKGKSWSTAIIP